MPCSRYKQAPPWLTEFEGKNIDFSGCRYKCQNRHKAQRNKYKLANSLVDYILLEIALLMESSVVNMERRIFLRKCVHLRWTRKAVKNCIMWNRLIWSWPDFFVDLLKRHGRSNGKEICRSCLTTSTSVVYILMTKQRQRKRNWHWAHNETHSKGHATLWVLRKVVPPRVSGCWL